MNDRLRSALHALPPQGLALKRHILKTLVEGFPKRLTITEVSGGGPNRTDASVRGALKTLDRMGIVAFVSQDETGDVARCQLRPDARDAVRAFLLDAGEEPRPLSPLPPRRAYQQVLRAIYQEPGKALTVKALQDKLWSERKSVNAPAVELFEAGYLLRDLTDESKHGRPEFAYRLNPDARDHADALLCAPTCSPQRRDR